MGQAVFSLLGVVALTAGGMLANAAEFSPIGKKIENFTARDFRGKSTSLSDFASDKVIVGVAQSQGCHIGRVKKPAADSEVTYTKHIAAILNANCVFCHRPGQIGPFPLTSYEESAGWAEMMREVVEEQRMPPWHADPK